MAPRGKRGRNNDEKYLRGWVDVHGTEAVKAKEAYYNKYTPPRGREEEKRQLEEAIVESVKELSKQAETGDGGWEVA